MRAWLVLAFCILGCGVLGCGIGHSLALDDGGVSQGDSGAGGGNGGSGGGGNGGGGGQTDAGLVSACPTSAPSGKTVCTQSGLECEYGSDPNIACNTLTRCEGGFWQTSESTGNECPTPAGNGSRTCGDSYANFPVGQSCPYQGLECGYPEGYCVCTTPFDGPFPIDASSAQIWFCDQAGQGCPSPRPRTGSPCNEAGQYCDYGGCQLPSGVVMRCQSGAWTEEPIACPDDAPPNR